MHPAYWRQILRLQCNVNVISHFFLQKNPFIIVLLSRRNFAMEMFHLEDHIMPFFIFSDIYVTHSMCMSIVYTYFSIFSVSFPSLIFSRLVSFLPPLTHFMCMYIFCSLDNFRFLDSFSHWLTDHVSRSNTHIHIHTLFNKFDLYSDQIILLNKWVELKRSCTTFPKTRSPALFHSFIAVSFACPEFSITCEQFAKIRWTCIWIHAR